MPFPPTFDHVWDLTQPPDTQLLNQGALDFRSLKDDVMQRMSSLSGTLANRPTPETVNATWGGSGFGLTYISTDTSQVFQWNGAAWVDISNSVGGKFKFESFNVTPVTVANSLGGNLQSITIGAGDMASPGQTFYFEAFGQLNATGGGTATLGLGLTLGGTQIGGGVGQRISGVMTGGNSLGWSLRGFFTILTTGVSGTIAGASMCYQSLISGGLLINTPLLSTVIDTTVSNNLILTCTWNVAAAQNSITQNTFNCYRVG